MDKFTINLQLFAEEGENIEDNADLTLDVDAGNQNVEESGDTQPELTEDTSTEQSTNKDNPANHAFAEMRREIARLKNENNTLAQKQKEKDEYYANLAKQAGRTDITTEEQYRKAAKLQDLSAKYQETNDPLILAEIIKETTQQMQQPQQPYLNEVDIALNKEVEEFNKEFKQALKSIDDIETLPNHEKIVNYMVNNNLPLSAAYKLANPDKIQAAAKQAAINQAKGHAHVTANSNAGKIDNSVVTAAEVAQWKQWFPGKTDEQCRKEIAENKKLFVD